MAIKAAQLARNRATGDYHRIQRVEMLFSALEPEPKIVIHMGQYVNKDAREEAPEAPLGTNQLVITNKAILDAGFPDFRDALYALAMLCAQFNGTNAQPDQVVADQSA